jgi:hypothetical protein
MVCWTSTSHQFIWLDGRPLGGAPATPGHPTTGHGYSRMDSNWNLQPIGPSAFTALKPDMVS